jgi:hypothetical protein
MDHRAVVPPGLRKVTVDLPPRKGFHTATQHTFDLERSRACATTWRPSSHRRTTQDWQPVIRSEERIVECESKFKVAGK